MKPVSPPSPSRKSFLLLGIAAFFSAVALRFVKKDKPKKEESIKMLTQEGLLVEIDRNIIAARGKRISDTELQQWVKKASNK
jgi:hypothetical protein